MVIRRTAKRANRLPVEPKIHEETSLQRRFREYSEAVDRAYDDMRTRACDVICVYCNRIYDKSDGYSTDAWSRCPACGHQFAALGSADYRRVTGTRD